MRPHFFPILWLFLLAVLLLLPIWVECGGGSSTSRKSKRQEEDVLGVLPKFPEREKTRRREAGTSQMQFTSEQESAIQHMLDQRGNGESSGVASAYSLEELKVHLKLNLADCKRYSSKPQFRQWLKQRNRYLAEATSRDQLRAVAIDVQQLHSNTAEKLRQIMDGQIASGNQDRNKQAARAHEEQVQARMQALLGDKYKGQGS